MPSDANRPCLEPLTAEMVKDVLWANGSLTNAALCEPIARTFNLVLADRLAQAQGEAEQAALEMAEQAIVEESCAPECVRNHRQAIRNLNSGTALELAKLRERLDEAEWWAEGRHDGVSDTCEKCNRLADHKKRILELAEREPAITLERRPQLERE